MSDSPVFPALPVIQSPASVAIETAGTNPPAALDLGTVHRLPRWLKRQVPLGKANLQTARLLDELRHGEIRGRLDHVNEMVRDLGADGRGEAAPPRLQ